MSVMDDGSQPPLAGLVFLLITAVFSALAETALASVQKSLVRVRAEKGDSRAVKTLFILDNFDRAVTTLLILTNIAHLGAASIVTVYVTQRWGLNAVTLSTIISTIFIFFACEMLPKSIAKKYSLRLSLACAPLLKVCMKVLSPLSFILTKIGSAAFKAEESDDVSVTEDELQDIIEDMAQEGSISEEEGDLISSALEFGDVTAERILTPRVDIQAIDIDSKNDEIFEFVRNQTHSRIPVYQGTIDNIIGVVSIRNYMKAYLKKRKAPRIKPLIDKVYYAHQSMEIHELLTAMSKNRLNLAVITDSYGGTLGIVTVEDILEELVGDIWDESDVVEESIVSLGNGHWMADADTPLDDVFDAIDFEDPQKDENDDDNVLLGQWCYRQFGRIPKAGQSFDYHNLKVTVDSIEHNRIMKVQLEVKK